MSDITAGLPVQSTTAPNETVTPANEPVNVTAGESVSFDQLDAIQENKNNNPNIPSDKTEPKEKKEVKKAKKETEETDEEETVSTKTTEAVEKQEKPVKLYKVRVGDKAVDVSANGSFEIEKDGKTIPVTVQDLVNSFHGTSEIHRRLTDLDVKSKKYDTDRKTVDTFVDKIAEYYKADKPLELVDFLVNTAGLDPAIYKMKLLESLTPEVEQLSSMSPEDKKAYQLELENQYLRRQQQATEKEKATSQEMNQLESHVKKVQASRGLDDKQFYSLYRELVDEGGFDENEITPESIADYADYKTVSDFISSEISKANDKYEGAETLVPELVEEMMSNSAISMEDMQDIIKEIVNDAGEAELSEKLSQSKPKPSVPKNPMSEPLTFDDLNF